jgi:hypothetical protein
MKPCAAPPIQRCGWYTAAEVEVKVVAAWTAGYGLGYPATYILSTVLRSLRELMYGGVIHHYQAMCYVSKHTVVYDEGE